MRVAFTLICIAVFVVAWHYLTPESAHWMGDEQLRTVTTVLFSGTLYAIVGLYIRDRV